MLKEWLNQTGILSPCQSDGVYLSFTYKYLQLDPYAISAKAEGIGNSFSSEEVRLVY